MSLNVGTLFGLLELEDKLTPAIKVAAEQAEMMGGKLDKLGSKISNVDQGLLPVSVAVGAFGLGAIKLASDFESSFAGVRKTVTASEPQLNALSDAFRKMSLEIPVNVNELNKIAEAGGQLGVAVEDLQTFTLTMAQMGTATNLSSDEAATALAQIANIIKDDAGPQYEKLGATIVALGNDGASTEKDITEFGLRLAAAGKTAGLTAPEILSIGSTLASVGINAEAGGTAFSKIFTMLAQGAQKGGEGVAEFARVANMSGDSFAKTFKEKPAEAITLFVEGFGKIQKTGGDLFGTLDKLDITEARMRQSLLGAASAGDLLRDALNTGNDAWEKQSALTKEAETRFATFESQLTIVWNQIKDVGITIGAALMPSLKEMLDILKPTIAHLADAAKWFAGLPEPVRMVALGFGAFVAVLGPLVIVLGTLISSVGAIVTGLGMLAPVFIALTGPIGLTVAAIAGLTAAWYFFGDDAIKIAKDFYNGVKTYLVDNFQAIVNGVKEKIHAITGFFSDMYGSIVGHSFVPEMVARIGQEMGRLDALMVQPGKKATKETKQAFKEMNDVIAQFSGSDIIKTGLQYVAVVERLGGTSKLTVEEQKKFNNALQDSLEKYRLLGIEAPKAMVDMEVSTRALISSTRLWKNELTTWLPGVTESMNALDASTILLAGHGAEGFANMAEEAKRVKLELMGIAAIAPTVVSSAGQIAEAMSTLPSTIGQLTAGFKDIIGNLGGTIMAAFTGGGNVAKALGGLFGGQLGTNLGELLGKGIGGKLGSTIGSFAGPIGTLLGGLVGDFLGPLGEKIGGFFKNLFGGPSGVEMTGRKAAQTFRDELATTLTSTQKAEAGTDEWKKSVIAVRDAFLAAGKTEAEAMAAMDKLWAAEKQGGDAVTNVIREIQTVMELGVKPATEAATASGTAGFNAMSNAVVIPGTELEKLIATIPEAQQQAAGWQLSGRTYEQAVAAFLAENPGDEHRVAEALADEHRRAAAMNNVPGFKVGTPNLGFGQFGAGTTVELHGEEAVVPKGKLGQFMESHGGSYMDTYDEDVYQEVRRLGDSLNRWIRIQPTMNATANRDYSQIGQRRNA